MESQHVLCPILQPLAAKFNRPAGGMQPFATIGGKRNQINPALYNSAAVALAQLLPRGVVPSSGQVSYAGAKQLYTYKKATARVDYDLSSTQRITVRSFLDLLDQPEQTLNGNILNNTLGERGRLYNELTTHIWTVYPRPSTFFPFPGCRTGSTPRAHVADASEIRSAFCSTSR